MISFKIVFEHPLFLLLLIPALAIIIFPFLKVPKKRRYTFKRIAPVVLHGVIVFLLILVIAGISFEKKIDSQSVMILVDCSDSMKRVEDQAMEKTEALLTGFSKDTEVGVIAFGKDSILVLDPKANDRVLTEMAVDSSGTDIASVLQYASSLFTEAEASRIILLSDGNETGGSAESVAYSLASAGIQIDVLYFDTRITEAEMQVVELVADEKCEVGDKIDFTLKLESNVDASVLISLYDNDEKIEELNVIATSGSNLFTLSTTAVKAGSHNYHVELTSLFDSVKENNQAYTSVTVRGDYAVLLVSEKITYTELLANFLRANGCEVKTSVSKNMPKTIKELCKYDEIILLNVNENNMPAGMDTLLDKYVSEYGRILLAVGGNATFQYGNMSSSKLSETLPVKFELLDSDNAQSVAIMLVLDCSSSMQGTNLTVAKQGAVNVVEGVSENDYVGIISFNTNAAIKAELTKATASNKEKLQRVISGLSISQGTNYAQALKLAYQELAKSTADVKHVIFLSDGSPRDSGYDTVVRQMAAEGITVTTIGLGVNLTVLSNMANIGGGRYYAVSSAKDLPDIMLSETQQVVVNSLIEEVTKLQIVKKSNITEGLEEANIPDISGYIGLTAKEKATVLISTENDRPILTCWEYGKGVAAVFASDLTGDWTEEWFTDEVGVQLIANICKNFIDIGDNAASMEVITEVDGTNVDITVTTEATQKDVIQAVIQTAKGEEKYELSAEGDGVYSLSLELAESGNYQLTLLQYNSGGQEIDSYSSIISINYSTEYDAFREEGKTVLLHFKEMTGGIFTEKVSELLKLKTGKIVVSKNPTVVFCILAMIMLLADIAIRKVRLKEIKQFFANLRTAKHSE